MTEYSSFNFDLQLIFASLNGRVSAAINRSLGRNLRNNDIPFTPEQWTILDVLWEHDKVTQKYICEMTCKDKPSMTRLIDNLVKMGLINRNFDPNNRRSNIISLTPAGKKLKGPTAIVINKTLNEVFNGITSEDIEFGQNLLRRIFDNMGD